MNKAAVIGGTIGAIYGVVLIILITFLILRRRKKQQDVEAPQPQMIETTPYEEPDEYFYITEIPRPEGPTPNETQENLYPPSLSVSMPARESEETMNTVIRTNSAANPFWMFDGTYYESEVGSSRARRSYSIHSVYTRTTRASSSFHHRYSSSVPEIPTRAFVSHMNATYPSAPRVANAVRVPLSFFKPQIREVVSAGCNREPSKVYLSGGRLQLPPINIEPLMGSGEIEKIVEEIMEGSMSEEEKKRKRPRKKSKSKSMRSKKRRNSHGRSLSVLSSRVRKKVRGDAK